jgi:Ni/Fe-hydrogenase subunit HybB-like protein
MKTKQQTTFFQFFISEIKPKGKVITPFNVISGLVVIMALIILVIRFKDGLGAVTHASQEVPWGLWINFNVITGVAFAGGAYVLTFMVYILGMEKYKPIVRATVLYALLAYMFYAGALLLDLGRPWKILNPIIGNSFGLSAVIFLVAWHFILYMGSLFIEFYPTVAEWATFKRQRKIFTSMTLAVVIFGIALSTLHQSGLGAIFLMAKAKIHPLWYSEFIPILFFISSIFAGLSLVIIIETINQRAFRKEMSFTHKSSHRGIILGLARTCSVAMFVYFTMLVLVFLHGKNYSYLNSGWGYWYLIEILGFVLVPCFIFMQAYRTRNLLLVRTASVLAVLGIILNRLNVTTIAFRWYDSSYGWPTWQEVVVCFAVIFVQIWVFTWIIKRMPVYKSSPGWVKTEEKKEKIIINKKEREKWKVSVE